VVAVYAAGYERTRSAAQRFAEAADRRPSRAAPRIVPVPHEASETSRVEPAVRETAAAVPAAPAKSASRAAPTTHRANTSPRHADSTKTMALADSVAPHAAPVVAPPPAPDSASKTNVAQTTDSAAATDKSRPYKDGTYSGWGTSRHGDIEASVLIKDGRIAAAIVSQCLTQYSCSWISELPGQVVARQSPEVDFVSGATQSTNAFYYAVVEALKKAK
jgi:uncharacterized protein with FMN-binding domain